MHTCAGSPCESSAARTSYWMPVIFVSAAGLFAVKPMTDIMMVSTSACSEAICAHLRSRSSTLSAGTGVCPKAGTGVCPKAVVSLDNLLRALCIALFPNFQALMQEVKSFTIISVNSPDEVMAGAHASPPSQLGDFARPG